MPTISSARHAPDRRVRIAADDRCNQIPGSPGRGNFLHYPGERFIAAQLDQALALASSASAPLNFAPYFPTASDLFT